MERTILVVVAHSDDQVFGPGGTVAKYAEEGAKVYTIIFSWGELSHPHFKKEIITKMRVEESQKADKIIGGSGVFFLGAGDGKIKQAIESLRLKEKLKDFFLKYKPEKIFTHASDEALPDHVIVNKLVCEVYDEIYSNKKLKPEVYSFGIWRFFRWKKRNSPKLVVDISKTFSKKLKALRIFKSQQLTMMSIGWSVYTRAFINGFKNQVQFAEVFNKIR